MIIHIVSKQATPKYHSPPSPSWVRVAPAFSTNKQNKNKKTLPPPLLLISNLSPCPGRSRMPPVRIWFLLRVYRVVCEVHASERHCSSPPGPIPTRSFPGLGLLAAPTFLASLCPWTVIPDPYHPLHCHCFQPRLFDLILLLQSLYP